MDRAALITMVCSFRWVATGSGASALEEDLLGLLSHLQSQSLAASSQQRYRSTWRQWCRWCTDFNYSPWLPDDPALASRQLALFAVFCYKYGGSSKSSATSGNSAQTILSKLSHIAWYHRWQCGFNIGLLPQHAMAIRGIQRLQPPPRPKQPVTLAILRGLHNTLNFNSAHDRVLWGATVMGFFFLLRRSEYLRKGNQQYRFAIRRSDVQFLDRDNNACSTKEQVARVVINFRGGKNDQVGVGVSRSLATSSLSWCCPVRALWYLVQHHNKVSDDPDELLCKADRAKFLQGQELSKQIKRAASLAGLDPERYSTHSLRIGGATALFSAGVDSLTIKIFGRWRSSAFERYTRIEDRLMGTMAARMVSSGVRPLAD